MTEPTKEELQEEAKKKEEEARVEEEAKAKEEAEVKEETKPDEESEEGQGIATQFVNTLTEFATATAAQLEMLTKAQQDAEERHERREAKSKRRRGYRKSVRGHKQSTKVKSAVKSSNKKDGLPFLRG